MQTVLSSCLGSVDLPVSSVATLVAAVTVDWVGGQPFTLLALTVHTCAPLSLAEFGAPCGRNVEPARAGFSGVRASVSGATC